MQKCITCSILDCRDTHKSTLMTPLMHLVSAIIIAQWLIVWIIWTVNCYDLSVYDSRSEIRPYATRAKFMASRSTRGVSKSEEVCLSVAGLRASAHTLGIAPFVQSREKSACGFGQHCIGPSTDSNRLCLLIESSITQRSYKSHLRLIQIEAWVIFWILSMMV